MKGEVKGRKEKGNKVKGSQESKRKRMLGMEKGRGSKGKEIPY